MLLYLCRTVLIRLLKFIVLISLCTHFVACAWYVFGCQAGECHSNTWALTAQLVNTTVTDADHYCNSLYWAVTTMTTTGGCGMSGHMTFLQGQQVWQPMTVCFCQPCLAAMSNSSTMYIYFWGNYFFISEKLGLCDS